MHGCLHLKQHSPVLFHTFRSHILQFSIERAAFHSANRQFDRHPFMDTADFRLVYFPPKDHIAHIGNSSDRRTVVESIRLDHRVTDLDRHIQDHTSDSRTNLCRTGSGRPFGDTFTDNLKSILSVLCLFLRLFIVGKRCFVIFFGDNPLFMQLFIPLEGSTNLFEADLRHPYTRFGTIQLNHFRDNLDTSNDLPFFHHLSSFFQQFGDDTRHLWFDKDFITRFDLSGRHGLRLNRVTCRGNQLIESNDRLRFLPQEIESADNSSSHKYQKDDPQDFFYDTILHNYTFLLIDNGKIYDLYVDTNYKS